MKAPKEYCKDYKGAAMCTLQGIALLVACSGLLLLMILLVEGVV